MLAGIDMADDVSNDLRTPLNWNNDAMADDVSNDLRNPLNWNTSAWL